MVDEIKIMQLADGTLPMDERAEIEKSQIINKEILSSNQSI